MTFNRKDVHLLHADGRLATEVRAPRSKASGTGLRRIELGGERDGLLHVPESVRPGRPAGLMVMLHGAGAEGQQMIDLFARDADRLGWILLAPDSRGKSWDIIVDEAYGRDVEFIDRALGRVFDRHLIDPTRIAVGGFSDGASYALSLGIGNGELFRSILAFSPGFVAPASVSGKASIFVSHGVTDAVLPIDRTSRRIVPRLEAAGYDVTYVEVAAGHAVPLEIRAAACAWLEPEGVIGASARSRRRRPAALRD